MRSPHDVPRIVIAAAASGVGKTTIAAGLIAILPDLIKIGWQDGAALLTREAVDQVMRRLEDARIGSGLRRARQQRKSRKA